MDDKKTEIKNNYTTPDRSSKIVRQRASKSGGERAPPNQQQRPTTTSLGISAEPTFQDTPPANPKRRIRAKKSAGVSLPFPPPQEKPPNANTPTKSAQAQIDAAASAKRYPKRSKKTAAVEEYKKQQQILASKSEPAGLRTKKTTATEDANKRKSTYICIAKPKEKVRANKTVAAEDSNKKRKSRSDANVSPKLKPTVAAARKSKRPKQEKSAEVKAKASSKPKPPSATKKSRTKETETTEVDQAWESDESSVIDMAEDFVISAKTSAIVTKICTDAAKRQDDKQAAFLQKLFSQNRRTANSSRRQRAARGNSDREHQNGSTGLDPAHKIHEDNNTKFSFGAGEPRDPPHTVWVPIRKSFWTADAVKNKETKTDRDTLRKRMKKYGPVASQEKVDAKIDVALRCLQAQLGDISGFINFVATQLGEPSKRVHERHRKMTQPKDPPFQCSTNPYRDLWCPQCTLYLCNRHSLRAKSEAGVELTRTKLVLENERSGKWRSDATTLPDVDESTLNACLSEGQKKMFATAFQTFEGDLKKLARFLRVPVAVAVEYATTKKMSAVPEALLRPIDFKVDPAKKALDYYSVENYTQSRQSDCITAKTLPESSPCYHEHMCDESNCRCIQDGHFCTRACVWGQAENSNFFRGCNCKGRCFEASSCPCYGAGRECDPSLCACNCCSDPVGQVLPRGQARNDHILMGRAPVLGIRKSTVKNAGWGCFSLSALRSGEYVGEYVGELISRNEAERRGAIDDEEKRSFLINLVSDSIVDSSNYGNKTRFINDSATANVEPRGMFVARNNRLTLTQFIFSYVCGGRATYCGLRYEGH